MNKEFLNKVLGHIMSETRIESTRSRVYTPYSNWSYVLSSVFSFPILSNYPAPKFSEHCENVYGLNNEEIDYVWKEYGNIIHDKIKNEQEVSK